MDEIIWKKLISWNIILENTSQNSYSTYRMFAIKIYQKDLTFLINHVHEITNMSNIISVRDYYDLIHNLLFLICVFSEDSNMLDFYFNEFRDKININHIETTKFCYNLVNREYNLSPNYLMHVLRRKNKSLFLVKYLIEECKIDTMYVDKWYNDDCLHYAINEYDFKSKTSFKIVKYLVDQCGMDIFKFGRCNKSYLWRACYGYGSDIKLIKYFVEEKRMNISKHIILGQYLDDVFGTYSYYDRRSSNFRIMNNTSEIVTYIIDNVSILDIKSIAFRDCYIELKRFRKFITYIKDYEKFNIILSNYLDYYLRKYCGDVFKDGYNGTIKGLVKSGNGYNTKYFLSDIINFLESIDPYLLNDENAKISGLDVCIKQLKLSFNEFVNCVDEYKCGKYVCSYLNKEVEEIRKRSSLTNNTIVRCTEYDYSQKDTLETNGMLSQSELLFVHNNIPYYGDKKLVYNSILLLKDIDLKNLDDAIIFEGKMPKYLVNNYLSAIIFKHFKIDNIDSEDIFEFIKFLDQYPSTELSLDKLEADLVEYFEANNIHFNEIIRDICKRYKFKYMYLHMHNKNQYNYTIGCYGEEDNNFK